MDGEHNSFGKEIVIEERRAMLEKLKQEFARQIPDEYYELAKTADIATVAPSYIWSVHDILKDDEVIEELAVGMRDRYNPMEVKEEVLTEMGKYLKEHLKEDTLVELCSGNQRFVPNLAEALHVKKYIGVDIEAGDSAFKRGNFEEYNIQDDMLLAVSKLPDNYGSFFVSGAEDYSGEMTQDDILPSSYMEKVMEEITRATRNGGLLILGSNNTFPDPEKYGFKQIKFKDNRECRGTFVLIKE